ncbi:unnamed protein product, partial [Ectocarpus sp. 8 AP-2014]
SSGEVVKSSFLQLLSRRDFIDPFLFVPCTHDYMYVATSWMSSRGPSASDGGDRPSFKFACAANTQHSVPKRVACIHSRPSPSATVQPFSTCGEDRLDDHACNGTYDVIRIGCTNFNDVDLRKSAPLDDSHHCYSNSLRLCINRDVHYSTTRQKPHPCKPAKLHGTCTKLNPNPDVQTPLYVRMCTQMNAPQSVCYSTVLYCKILTDSKDPSGLRQRSNSSWLASRRR